LIILFRAYRHNKQSGDNPDTCCLIPTLRPVIAFGDSSGTLFYTSSSTIMSFAAKSHIGAAEIDTGAASDEIFPSEEIDIDSSRPPSPQSNWNVSDTDLRPMPSLHPPIDRRCAVFIDFSKPSVVAARIADCLRRRSIVAEYNDGMV